MGCNTANKRNQHRRWLSSEGGGVSEGGLLEEEEGAI
jgi:hypothetical protein